MLPTYAHVVQMYPFQNGLMTTPFYTYVPYYMHPPQYNPPQYMVNLPATTQLLRPVTLTHIKRKNKHDNNSVKRPKRDPTKLRWNCMFDMLQAYCEEDGTDVNDGGTAMKQCTQTKSCGTHIVAGNQEDTSYEKLGGWCIRQRFAYRNEKAIKTTGKKINNMRISSEQIRKLESIGFAWDRNEHQWTKMFDMLRAYCQEDGTDVNDGRKVMEACIQTKSVGTHIVADNQKNTTYKKLGIWCQTQRAAYRNEVAIQFYGKTKNTFHISPERIRKLESIGFKYRL